jgi:hypothetical protein
MVVHGAAEDCSWDSALTRSPALYTAVGTLLSLVLLLSTLPRY